MADRDEKIFPALPQKRQRAREQGQIARSRELVAAFSFLVATVTLVGAVQITGSAVMSAFRQAAGAGRTDDLGQAIMAALFWPLIVVLVISGFLALSAGVAAVVQGGLVFSPSRLLPDLSRLNPVGYFGRIFATSGLIELGKATFKIALIALLAWRVARSALDAGVASAGIGPQLLVMGAALRRLLSWSVALALVTAGADYAHKRYEYEADLRMTRQELLDELKHEEGNPQVKRAIRRAMRRSFKRIRGIHQVATATVVLTNPTHYAVALRYRRCFDQAPLVVAKGAGDNALRLIALARVAAVPVMENKLLARALFRAVEAGDQIPRQFYRAVAEVLTMIMRAEAQRRQALLQAG